MQYNNFKKIFNETIFEESKIKLLENIAKYPNRYIGLFRPTKPKAKILQNLLQSHEIRFGDAFEKVLERYALEFGFELLPKRFRNKDGEELNLDQCFRTSKRVYFIEQKVRDDHDSTKKRGQIQNFEKKLNEMIPRYGEKNLVGVFYFIDPDLKKNKNYYRSEIEKMSRDYGVELYLFYGDELFTHLEKVGVWGEILGYLTRWKQEIPDFPETNLDTNADISFEEIKDLSPALYRSLFRNDEIFTEIMLTLFPERTTLKLLLKYFQKMESEKTVYRTLAAMLEERLL
jgi:hypothetical protein